MEIRTQSLIQRGFHYPRRPLQILPTPEHTAQSVRQARPCWSFTSATNFTFDVSSESLAGVTRHFTSFSGAAEEAGLSRIYAGQHFRTDHIAGKDLGEQVAQSIDENILLQGK